MTQTHFILGEGAEDTGIPEDFLLQVRGNDSHNTRASQVKQHSIILFVTMITLKWDFRFQQKTGCG
jgi:hypothetical protein